MIVDPSGVFSILGLNVGKVTPVVTHCPLCGSRNKLEIRSVHTIRCHGCHFYGDVLDLIVAAKNDTFDKVAAALISKGYIAMSDSQVKTAAERHGVQSKWRKFIQGHAAHVRAEPPPYATGILETYKVKYPHDLVARLYPHAFPLLVSDIAAAGLELPNEAKPALKFWGKRGAFVVPTFHNVDLIGMWVITINGYTWMPVVKDIKPSTGFCNYVSIDSPAVSIVNCPLFAFRSNLLALTAEYQPIVCVAPVGVVDTTEFYGAQRVVYWAPNEDAAWYVRALQTANAKVLTLPTEDPCAGDYFRFKQSALTHTQTPHAALAQYLVKVPEDAAKEALAGVTLEPLDKAKCLAQLSGDDVKYVESLLNKHVDTLTVTWNGHTFVETSEGWLCKGKIISAATLRLHEVEPDGDDAFVTGVIVFRRKAYPFKTQYSAIRKNVGAWITNFLVRETGQIPFIESSWSSKLLEVAQQFKQPVAILGHERYGWKNSVLRVSNVVVGQDGIQRTTRLANGPQATFPIDLDEMNWKSFKQDGFCRLWLALLGNLVRTQQQRAPFGIAVTNEPYVPQRLASALGCEFTSPEVVLENHMMPFPQFCEWNERTARGLFAEGVKPNTVISLDRVSAALVSIRPEWLTLRVGEAIDYTHLVSVVAVLPHTLRNYTTFNPTTLFRDLYAAISTLFPEDVQRSLRSAAGYLDLQGRFQEGNEAGKILSVMQRAVAQGAIEARLTDAEVTLSVKSLREFMTTPFVPAPDILSLAAKLQDARFLTEPVGQDIVISRTAWDLTASFSAA